MKSFISTFGIKHSEIESVPFMSSYFPNDNANNLLTLINVGLIK